MDTLHATTVGDIAREHARSYPSGVATVCEGYRSDYATLDKRCDQLAAALTQAGFGAGDRLLWLGQNCHRVLECLVAVARLGGIFCPANWRQTAQEMAFVIEDADPAFIVWQDAEIGAVVREARASTTSSARWLQLESVDDCYEAFVDSGAEATDAAPVDVDPGSSLLMMYTAAFGGRPNGALLSHTAMLSEAVLLGSVQGISSDYVYLNAGPLFHIATLMTTLSTFVMAGTNVFVRRTDAGEICRLINDERCNGAFLMKPTIEQILVENKDGSYDLSSLRVGRGPAAWRAMTTPDTNPYSTSPGGFGQTEVMGMLTLRCLGPTPIGGSGRPLPLVQVRIVDPDGNDVEPGETGEMVARGPTVMNAYWNRPELTVQRQSGNWHHTFDLARREVDGSITFVGPKTRIIKSAAENIYPAEVEGCLKAHPAVADAAVIGVPDARWQQSVKALVVRAADATVTGDELVEHCRQNIASYKKPRTVEFLDELPYSSGTVDYDLLDAKFGGGGYPGSG